MLVVVDTGGTKTLVSSFNHEGVLGKQIKFPTPKDQKEYIKALSAVLLENFENKPIKAVIIGTPGIVNDGVVIWGGGNLKWNNLDIKSEISKIFSKKISICVENDAVLAGLGETRSLKSIPAQSLYVTVSTGIGTGIITNGHINDALRHSEAGHALIEYDGVVREWESFASGKAIFKAYGKYAKDIKNKRIWGQIADRISRGFLAVIPILQPDVIIIGGSIGTYFNEFGEKLQNILKEKLPTHIPCPKFIKAKHPELAVIYGCYYYAVDNLDITQPKK